MKNIGKIIKLARPLRNIFFIITAMITLGALVDLVMPVLLKLAVDAVTKQGVHFKSMQDLWRYPFSYALTLLVVIYGLNLSSQALSNLSSRLGDHLAGKLRKFLTETFFEKALTLSQTYYDGELSGKIINQLNRGVQVITDFFNTATNFIVPSFLQAIFTIALLAYYNPLTALFMTILFPVYIYFSAASTKNWSKYQLKRNVYEDIVRGRLSESILNIRLVWMAKGLFNRQLSLGWNVQTGALLSFWFVLGLSMSVAEEVSWALRKMLFLMSFFPLYFPLFSSSRTQFDGVRDLAWKRVAII
jgi:ATP-binding cassette subfamily B protein